jgi:hypothetical protein
MKIASFLFFGVLVACSSSSSELFPGAVVEQPSISQENLGCGSASFGGRGAGQACSVDADCAWTCCACTEAPLTDVTTPDCDGKRLENVLGNSFSSRQCVKGTCADHAAACGVGTATFHMCRCTGTGDLI